MAERGCDVRVSQRTPGSPQVGPSPDRKCDSSPELRRNKRVEFKISELLRPAGIWSEQHMRGERGIGGGCGCFTGAVQLVSSLQTCRWGSDLADCHMFDCCISNGECIYAHPRSHKRTHSVTSTTVPNTQWGGGGALKRGVRWLGWLGYPPRAVQLCS